MGTQKVVLFDIKFFSWSTEPTDDCNTFNFFEFTPSFFPRTILLNRFASEGDEWKPNWSTSRSTNTFLWVQPSVCIVRFRTFEASIKCSSQEQFFAFRISWKNIYVLEMPFTLPAKFFLRINSFIGTLKISLWSDKLLLHETQTIGTHEVIHCSRNCSCSPTSSYALKLISKVNHASSSTSFNCSATRSITWSKHGI